MRWESEAFGHDYRAEVLERDYEGEPEAKALGAAPTLRMDDSESGVRGTSLELTIQADRDGELTTLYTTDNKRYRVDLYRDEELAWTGYVLPEEYSEPYVSAPYDVAVTATDGLGILKDIPFELTGERTIFEVVAYCCGQTGLGLDYALLSALREEGMAAGEPMHTQTMCDAGAFAGMDCYEALEAAMTSLDSFVTEWRGMWLVARHTDLTGTYTRHGASGQKTGTGRLPELTLGAIGDDCYPVGEPGDGGGPGGEVGEVHVRLREAGVDVEELRFLPREAGVDVFRSEQRLSLLLERARLSFGGREHAIRSPCERPAVSADFGRAGSDGADLGGDVPAARRRRESFRVQREDFFRGGRRQELLAWP